MTELFKKLTNFFLNIIGGTRLEVTWAVPAGWPILHVAVSACGGAGDGLMLGICNLMEFRRKNALTQLGIFSTGVL